MMGPARRDLGRRTSRPGKGTRGSEAVLFQQVSQCSTFASLPPSALREILAKGQTQRIKKRGIVFRQGSPVDAIHLLIQGRIKLLLSGSSGRAIILSFVNPGEVFGCIGPVVGHPRVYAAQAVEDSATLSWDWEMFDRLMGRYPAITRNMLHVMARQVHSTWIRLCHVATESVSRRTARALLRFARPAGHGRAPVVNMMQQDLADLVGTTPPTLSRILGNWETRGLVTVGRQHVVLLRPQELFRFAEADDAARSELPHSRIE